MHNVGPSTRCYVLSSPTGAPLAPFKAGSFIPVLVEAGDSAIECPYAISSSPREAEQGAYRIVVKRGTGGYSSTRIADTWQLGDRIVLGMPVEDDAFSRLDAGEQVVAIAGSVGIVLFHSIAKAIAEGDADYRLALFYTAQTLDELLYRDEWRLLEEQSGGRLKVVPVLSAQDAQGCERGPVTRAMIERHADVSEATFLIRGPATLVAAMRLELAPLNLSRRRLRSAFSGDSEFRPAGLGDATYWIDIRMGGETRTIPAREDETILEALEKAGLQPSADCRTGICGLCGATLVSGKIMLASDEEGTRKVRERYSTIHPCCSYPCSDMEIVVQQGKVRRGVREGDAGR